MCILFIAIQQHPQYPLIIAANRDEFFQRPTQASHFWPPAQYILAGKDLQAGGSWMGINKQGYIAALTNIRDPNRLRNDVRSRGELVLNYLQHPPANTEQQKRLQTGRLDYNGYNLLFGHWQSLRVYNNFSHQYHTLGDGVYGLSNADLNSDWPKVNRGIQALSEYCQSGEDLNHNRLFELLGDQQQAEEHCLPVTGVPWEWEKRLSAIFIRGEEYGTRSSTLLTIDSNNKVHWIERRFDNHHQQLDQQEFEFTCPPTSE